MFHLGALQYDRAPKFCYWLSVKCIPDFQGLEFVYNYAEPTAGLEGARRMCESTLFHNSQ